MFQKLVVWRRWRPWDEEGEVQSSEHNQDVVVAVVVDVDTDTDADAAEAGPKLDNCKNKYLVSINLESSYRHWLALH